MNHHHLANSIFFAEQLLDSRIKINSTRSKSSIELSRVHFEGIAVELEFDYQTAKGVLSKTAV